jgi:adenosine tuberculosinyltransferase
MEKMMIAREEFLQLSTLEVAKIMRAEGSQTGVLVVDGTRRWFVLEYSQQTDPEIDFFERYLTVSIRRHVELCAMMFEHGINTLLTPVFGSELLKRGDEYTKKVGIDGFLQLATAPTLLDFCKINEVRVKFYGDYIKFLQDSSYSYALDALNEVTEKTRSYTRSRLFFGLFADNPTETIAELSVQHFLQTGKVPSQKELIKRYYGEDVEPASLFIGFGKFCVFDYPLLQTGAENLYFSISPSPYATEKQLRTILYDHLYTRRLPDPDYESLAPETIAYLQKYYQRHQDNALGVGNMNLGVWTPNFYTEEN